MPAVGGVLPPGAMPPGAAPGVPGGANPIAAAAAAAAGFGANMAQDPAVMAQLAQMQALQQQQPPPAAGGNTLAAAALPGMAGAGGMPGVPGMPGMAGLPGIAGMAPGGIGMIDSSTKTQRELFVGNTPPNTSEMVLMEFMNRAMLQVKLNTAPGNPIIQCRVSNKFAFIEMRTIEETNAALNLNGIPFNGNMLKIGRPAKYQGAHVPASTWQQLTGQVSADTAIDPMTKVYRELFIGNTSPEMNEVDLQEFLGQAMQQVGLTTSTGNPIVTTRLSGKFAFIELRSIEETNNALNLNGIPYMGMLLRVGRPSKYQGPAVPHMDWNDLLVKYMNGELKPMVAAAPPTRVISLMNMVTEEDVRDDNDYAEIVEDTREECKQFGNVTSVVIPRSGEPGVGKVYVEFGDLASAQKASDALTGRTFDGRRVEVAFFSEDEFAAKKFS